jgi:hypothetical protein
MTSPYSEGIAERFISALEERASRRGKIATKAKSHFRKWKVLKEFRFDGNDILKYLLFS